MRSIAFYTLFPLLLMTLTPKMASAQFKLGYYSDGPSSLDITAIQKPGSENLKLTGPIPIWSGCTGAWYGEYDYGISASYAGLPITQSSSSASGSINCGGSTINLGGSLPPLSAAFVIQANPDVIDVNAKVLGGTYTMTTILPSAIVRIVPFQELLDVPVTYTVYKQRQRPHTRVGTPRTILEQYAGRNLLRHRQDPH